MLFLDIVFCGVEKAVSFQKNRNLWIMVDWDCVLSKVCVSQSIRIFIHTLVLQRVYMLSNQSKV